MKRWNKETRQWERKDGETWVALEQAETDLDTALEAAFEEVVAAVQPDPAPPPETVVAVADLPAPASDHPAAGNGELGDALDFGRDLSSSIHSVDVVDEVPGLVSGDGARGVAGARGVRERLQKLKSRKAPAQVVQVGPRSARAVGPAVKDTTSARQARTRAQVVAQSGSEPKQRYTNRPAPELLAARPKWVQDLFEAHFRSDLTLGMRRTFNRMKISRQDYAIGWLTLLDKVREDPSVLRLKDRENGA